MKTKTAEELSREADHIWHVWMNRYSDAETSSGRDWPRSLYEFKGLLHFIQWGWMKIRDAFTGTLPQAHKQCSLSEPEPIKDNRLTCCLGVDVTECSILASLKATFEEQRAGKFYAAVPDEEMYRRMAQTCAWHIYRETCSVNDAAPFKIDTSEGHVLDAGDRMFWNRVYSSMSESGTANENDPAEDAAPEAKGK